ncbi:MAG: DUF4292 domain-containing protein [Bacteroidota bacterium]
MFRYLLFSLSILLLFAQCKGTRQLTNGKQAMTANVLKKQLIENQVSAQWFSANARIGVNGGGFSQSGNASIRIRKDSVIWVSVKKLGFEVARALITKDSVHVLDRFNRQYISNDLNFLIEEYQLPASLETLQAILLGNPVFFGLSELNLSENEATYMLSTAGNQRGIYTLDKTDFRLQQMELIDQGEDMKLSIDLKDYQPLADGQLFSYIRQFNASNPSTGDAKMSIEYQQVTINEPKTIRFSVPDRYERVE